MFNPRYFAKRYFADRYFPYTATPAAPVYGASMTAQKVERVRSETETRLEPVKEMRLQ